MIITGSAHGTVVVKGGPGSGFAGHAGRPGEVGGSAAEGSPHYDTIYQVEKPHPSESRGHEGMWAVMTQTGLPDSINKGGKWELDEFPTKAEAMAYYNDAKSRTKPITSPKVEGVVFINSYDEVQTFHEKDAPGSKGYLISGKDNMVDINSEFGGGTNDHVGFVAASEAHDEFGLNTAQAKRFLKGYDDGDGEEMSKGWDRIFKSGAIRVREFGNELSIQSDVVDTSTLKRLQRLYDNNKLGLNIKQKITWQGNSDLYGTTDIRDVTMEDFLSAKYAVNGVLKEFAENVVTLPRMTAVLKSNTQV